ncbi:hypothetical protein H1D32_00145 [Anaerobacillus sp. CMMVII]|uniref:hypothetical protein n=1 Tax=Anaerobacillus sp. CMMVII TaxID=2755588 RepID=UPI0021B7B1AF|nr:hypothetical protein [Anaerobacillus sp. CMMVII]MCT8136332.1 hypothetical protein [Anaerobacillus sp. CMMVII]
MKKLVRGFVLLVAVLLLQLTILPPNEALSDNQDMSLTQLNIKVMPEFINPEGWDYNIPSLLVGYHGTFVNNSDLPFTGEIKFSAPTHLESFTPGFVAKFENYEDTNPVEEDYTVNLEEGYFSWIPQNPIAPGEEYYFVVEYFVAAIEGVVDRSFTFEYAADFDVENMSIDVYAPYRVENFKIDKEADLNSMTFGLEFHMYEYTDVKQGEVYDLTVSYTKDNIVTTMEALNDFSAPDDDAHAGMFQPAPTQNSGFLSTENVIMLILILVFVGAFVFLILRKKKDTPKEVIKTPKKIVNKEEEIKRLRKMLADGAIDEKMYKEKRAKLG